MRAKVFIILSAIDFLLALYLNMSYDSAIWIALVAIFVKMDELK